MVAEAFASMFKYFTLRKTKQPINVTGCFYQTDSGELLAGVCFLSFIFTVQCQVTDKVGDMDAAPETCFRKVLQRSKQQYHLQTKLTDTLTLCTNSYFKWMRHTYLTTALRMLRQVNLWESRLSLVYSVSLF